MRVAAFCASASLAVLILGPPASAQPASAPPVSAARDETPAPRDIKALVRALGKDLVALPSRDMATVLGVGSGLALAAHPGDEHINDQLRGRDYRFLTSGRVLGNAGLQMGAALGTYWVGHAWHARGKAAHVGYDLVRAQILTQGLTLTLKVTVRRERPDGTSFSFPSGHASTAFASATVLSEHFGWRVAVPTYVVGAYIASSRLHQRRHFPSDVIFGAALGTAVGRTIVHRHGPGAFTWMPVVEPGRMAILVSRRSQSH